MAVGSEQLVHLLRTGDRRALARVLTILENEEDASRAILELLFPVGGRAFVVGFTGAPGAGKSTLVDQLVLHLVKGRGSSVAVVAVDPSSPFTGGALLGDRIRMAQATEIDGVFVRSMASRGTLGGLAPHTSDFIFALDAAGFDYIVIETVGVGQGEVEVVRVADTVVVTLVPGMGDGVQALKAGILEIADVFSINKADYDGANRLERELLAMLSLEKGRPRKPSIVRTVATDGTGIAELAAAIEEHHRWARESGALDDRRRRTLQEVLQRRIVDELYAKVEKFLGAEARLERAADLLVNRRRDPASLARDLVEEFVKSLSRKDLGDQNRTETPVKSSKSGARETRPKRTPASN